MCVCVGIVCVGIVCLGIECVGIVCVGIVVDQGMPRTRGLLGGPHIMGWIAQGPTAKQRQQESKCHVFR